MVLVTKLYYLYYNLHIVYNIYIYIYIYIYVDIDIDIDIDI